MKAPREWVVRSIEAIVDVSGVANELEKLLGAGRPRQLPVRTLLIGMIGCGELGEAAYLDRIHSWLLRYSHEDQLRLGIARVDRRGEVHQLTYRQIEYLFNRIARLCDREPVLRRRKGERTAAWVARMEAANLEGAAADVAEALLMRIQYGLLNACRPKALRRHGTLSVDWTDVETPARRRKRTEVSTDRNASWGYRRSKVAGQKTESYLGYKETAVVLTKEKDGSTIPELVVGVDLTSAGPDAVPSSLKLLRQLIAESEIIPGDLLADAAYPQRVGWSMEARALGFDLVVDLNSNDAGFRGTEQGAIVHNGDLYCPGTPKIVFDIRDLASDATEEDRERHAKQWAELERYQLQTKGRPDADGYQRMSCRAVGGKVRCPLVPTSMDGGTEKPTVHQPPAEPPACCTQRSFTVSPAVGNKVRQKYPWKDPRWTESYSRRTTVERAFARIKDQAGESLSRGSVRVLGRTKIMLLRVCRYVLQNIRLLWRARQAAGQPKPRNQRAPRRDRPFDAISTKRSTRTHDPPA